MSIARQFQKASVVKEQKPTLLDISLIRRDGGTQPRESINDEVASSYAEEIQAGTTFPPVTVFYDGEAYWLADGFHRVHAHFLAGKKKVAVHVRQGRRRDAILFSVGANATHGLRRTNADKRQAVETLLRDPEWSKWSDAEIAKRCAVSREFVNRTRPTVTCDPITSERTYVTRHGTTAIMDTSAISGAANRPDFGGSVPEDEEASDLSPPISGTATEIQTDTRQQHRDALPDAIKEMEARKQQAIAARREAGSAEQDADRIAELEEAVRSLETEVEALRAENKLYGEMRVQFEQGGFDKVIAGKDEEIRVLQTRLYRESGDKAAWMKSAKTWKKRAESLGYSPNEVIDPEADTANG